MDRRITHTHQILARNGLVWEVIIADDNIFVVCPMRWDKLERAWVTNYDHPEVYSNLQSINTLTDLRFRVATPGDFETARKVTA